MNDVFWRVFELINYTIYLSNDFIYTYQQQVYNAIESNSIGDRNIQIIQ